MPNSLTKRQNLIAASIISLLLLIFFVVVFFFSPSALPEYKQRMLAIICALLASSFVFFLTGGMELKIKSFESPLGKIDVKATGAVGVFVFVLVWWFTPLAPIRVSRQIESIYKVRVTVIDPQQVPVEDGHVWSSIGGEPKRVAGGWQFDIPAGSTPADGKLTIYASKKTAFLSGKQELKLGEDFNPAVTVQLQKETSTYIRGIVTDESGRSVAGARVSVIGHEGGSVVTQETGNFLLPAHAAEGQQIQLRVEKKLYEVVTQWHPAGSEPATVVIEKKK